MKKLRAQERGARVDILHQVVALHRRVERASGALGPTPRHDSDLDVLIVADGLPRGRMARVEDFATETDLEPRLAAGRQAGFFTDCSPAFKTPDEALAGSPLFLDMVDDARILYDRDGVFAAALERVRARLARLGAGGSGVVTPGSGISSPTTRPARSSSCDQRVARPE